MKYTITHRCGHEQAHQIYGSNSRGQRDRKEEWLETRDCTACWQAEQEKARAERQKAYAAESAAAAEANKSLPALEGSLKQIAWAESIRKTALDKMREIAIKCPPEDAPNDASRQACHKLKALIEQAEHNTSAKWWIEIVHGYFRFTELNVRSVGRRISKIISDSEIAEKWEGAS